jgi:large subunit ribosomal protein L44e
MKLPKAKRTHCPFCKKHTEHKVYQVKKGKPSSLSRGSKYRARLRGRARGFGSLGRYSKPAVTKFKMTGKKQTKKTDIKYQCPDCKKFHVQRQGFRAKRIELI